MPETRYFHDKEYRSSFLSLGFFSFLVKREQYVLCSEKLEKPIEFKIDGLFTTNNGIILQINSTVPNPGSLNFFYNFISDVRGSDGNIFSYNKDKITINNWKINPDGSATGEYSIIDNITAHTKISVIPERSDELFMTLEITNKGSKEHLTYASLLLILRYIRKFNSQELDEILNRVFFFDKNGIKNYIGGNTLMEIGFAHVLNQKIFLWNPIPDIPYYKTEIEAVRPTIINGDLTLIK